MLIWIALVLAGFLSGSIPFGLLIARAKGIDIRTSGSGNIGATNLGRVLGPKYFWLGFALDFTKGLVPTLVAGRVLGGLGVMALEPAISWKWLAVALATVLGHIFCPWLKFKGGKGVATAAGAFAAIFPAMTVPMLVTMVFFASVTLTWRYVSLGSILAAGAMPVLVAAWFHLASIGVGPHPEGVVRVSHMVPFLVLAVLLAALVIWAHRGNIARLRAGTERRLGQPASPAAGSGSATSS